MTVEEILVLINENLQLSNQGLGQILESMTQMQNEILYLKSTLVIMSAIIFFQLLNSGSRKMFNKDKRSKHD